LAAIAQVFATEGVSIQTVRQSGRGNDAELIVVSHGAKESALSATVKALSNMDIVTKVESVLRVQGSQS
jgi:homoserine dehydrogenase